jgi:HSP20 family protein
MQLCKGGSQMAKHDQSSKKKSNVKKQSSSAIQRSNETRADITRRESTPFTGSPFTFMRRFSEEMDRLFEDFGFGRGWLAPGFEGGLDRLGTLGGASWAPQVEVIERDNQLIVRADLPGMSKDDVQVDIDDNSLIIRGERKTEHEENEEGYYRSERSYGSFYRQIPLPSGVDTEQANAEFRNGVLEITLPAPARSREERRQIAITGETQEQPRARAKSAGQR